MHHFWCFHFPSQLPISAFIQLSVPRMLTPTEKKLLIFTSLSEAQKTLATGRISDPPVLQGNDVARSLSYFDNDLTELIRKISLSSANAILFADETVSFRILSSPWLALDSSNREILVGQS
jgi:hypothetical protein